jgi:hypothetical protein
MRRGWHEAMGAREPGGGRGPDPRNPKLSWAPGWQRNSPLVESKLGHRVPSSRSPSLRPRASPSPGWSYLAPSGGEAPKEPKIAPAMMELSLLVLGSLARSHTSAPRPPAGSDLAVPAVHLRPRQPAPRQQPLARVKQPLHASRCYTTLPNACPCTKLPTPGCQHSWMLPTTPRSIEAREGRDT